MCSEKKQETMLILLMLHIESTLDNGLELLCTPVKMAAISYMVDSEEEMYSHHRTYILLPEY